ncbi:hypothetical protein QWJ07_32920 [Frankia sp. RB7]|nr:hypothetical protein [Frankia sp. RB7]
MTPRDEQRFADLIRDFVESCGYTAPFHLVTIDARGTTSVVRYGLDGIAQVCSGPTKAHRLKMLAPLVVTCIASDGRGTSAKITSESARITF